MDVSASDVAVELTSTPTSTATPDYRVVILGAGRSVRGTVPSALAPVDRRRCVLDWLLDAFARLPSRQVHFVGGYNVGALTGRHEELQFLYNPVWEVTGPAASLALAPLESKRATYVSYSDIVYRPEVVGRLEESDGDVALAIDTRWRVRYDGRPRAELEEAEKVLAERSRFQDIGKHIDIDAASAEFVGLVRLSARAASRLGGLLESGAIDRWAGLPDLVARLAGEELSVSLVDVEGDWAELNLPQDLAHFVLGTKAESLERLRPLVKESRIGRQVAFTQKEWSDRRARVIACVEEEFGDAELIVRSSALSEDGWLRSSAGAYKSIAGVRTGDESAFRAAVDEVVRSYGEELAENQVLVQKMLTDVTVSGVVMTRTPTIGAPYYVVNFDSTSRRTDTVTSGTGASTRTLFVHRDAELPPGLPGELHQVLASVRELEHLVGHDSLDIEFACTAGETVHVLQVRPIALAHRETTVDDGNVARAIDRARDFFRDLQKGTPFVLGRSTQLSVMSDWNPAEIIGVKPRKLPFSLYRYLITDEIWARQRAEYGYRDVRPCPLLVDILGHPYVDVRATFNSFVPASLPDALAGRLLDFYLETLSRQPELHDKVEFDVLFTCLTFDFDGRVTVLRDAGFSTEDIERLRAGLLQITRGAFVRIARDEEQLALLRDRFERIRAATLPPLERAFLYLEDARRYGTLPFAHLARGAFVAVSLLRSLEEVGATNRDQTEGFLASLETVSGEMQRDAAAVAGGRLSWDAFVEKYGHLRPGTYDITSPSYGSAPEDYLRPMVASARPEEERVLTEIWDGSTRERIREQLTELGLEADVEAFERYLRRAIALRESSKFVFTRNLSAALECLAEFGAAHSLARDDLVNIRIEDLFDLRGVCTNEPSARLRALAEEGREAYSITEAVCLPGQVFSIDDLSAYEQTGSAANFVTRKRVRAPVASLRLETRPGVELGGRIVLVPNADPGFDWIFSRQIAGLVTMYGGINSHMAIRAAEFELPAAIGVGGLLFAQLVDAEVVELDCGSQRIDVVR